MATINMVNLRDEARGLNLARRIVGTDPSVETIAWWADREEAEPRLLVGFTGYREGPRAVVERLSGVLAALANDAPDFLDVGAVPAEDPRLQALVTHPWTTVRPDSPDLTYRLVNVWSRSVGSAQALVYFLKVGEEIRVPLPPPLPQTASLYP